MTEAQATLPASPARPVKTVLPSALEVLEAVAVQNGVCIRPVPLKRIDLATGRAEIVDVPCGATLESKCPACAKRNRQLRMAQCREGWHLDHEPVVVKSDPDEEQRRLVEQRADLQAARDRMEEAGDSTTDLDAVIADLDARIRAAGVRGEVLPDGRPKRTRSTRRRQDAPDLPRRTRETRTVGQTFTAPDGKTYRPSLFVTLTLPGYGRVRQDGTPVDPDTYDYVRAARDALHFSKLVDRFVQNLRRVAGYDVQYFSSVEPQRRLAPHLHMAVRGTLPRREVKAIAAATYHQVWWPPVETVVFEGDHLPVWADRPERAEPYPDRQAGDYLDPVTGELLPTWDQALDRLDADEEAEPFHVLRFGVQVDVQGVLAGTPDADQCIRYLGKYLTKSVGECHTPETDAQRRHVQRLADVLRYEPCAPTCPNWLRYGVQPKNAKAGMRPGACRSKAHKPEHLGYAGRRVLVSRKWSGKTLREHKADRRAWVMEALGLTDDQPADRYAWRPVVAGDPDLPSRARRLLRQISERQRWRRAMQQAEARAAGRQDLSATALAA
ncbi:replication initiator [Planomonospora parontospora]|uniref:replication initiator n=1 Tax=Planomonospora parontospora TaxID=58119 RepID=UPI00166FFC2F|nr:replication initiator [Planomonospora parontospora]GGL23610.1 hypothetical protein GCM10014719_26670 [Planomonospora parontospora subsp. antibiotica]GII15031.1 hypothetical protein Ppa05_17570 [Planomonospora parontospora subsp. antibiotica]